MINTTPWTGGTDEEYETQHFGFGVQTFKIAVREMVEQKIGTGVKDLESYLQESQDLNDTDKITLTHAFNKIIRLYCERAGPAFQRIDAEIESLIKVPENVLLPEDEVHNEEMTDADFENLKEEVKTLKKRVERGALMKELLIAQLKKLSPHKKYCELAEKDMKVLNLLIKSEGSDNIQNILNETMLLCASTPFMEHEERNN